MKQVNLNSIQIPEQFLKNVLYYFFNIIYF